MAKAALGFRAHTGWAAAVAIAGAPSSPVVFDRRRIDLRGETIPFEAYHVASHLDLPQAEDLVRGASEVAIALATEAMREMIDRLRGVGHRPIGAGVLVGYGQALPPLSKILVSHPSMHAAEGELYRDALIQAAQQCGLPVTGVPQRDALSHAAAALSTLAADLSQRVTDLGRGLGPPWTRDQKDAAAAAWLALSS